jgi:hypothetical protein
MITPKPSEMARNLARADVDAHKRLVYGLRSNARVRHDPAAVAHLIELELARSAGMAVRITDLGYQVLAVIR